MSTLFDDTTNSAPTPSTDPITRRTFLKGATAGAVFLAGGASLAACGSTSSAPAGGTASAMSGEVVIWDRAGDLFQVFDATIPAFNKKYPNIHVKHVAVDVDAKLPTTLTTGVNLPDGAFYEDNNLPVLAEHYYDITDWIQPYVKDIVPFKVRVNTHNGRIVGIPFDLDPGLLYYREDLLQKAGVDPTQIATYDDLLTAARTVRAKLGPSVKPIHLDQDPGLGQSQIEMFANQQGVSMVDGQGKLRINSDPYLKIMQWIKSVHDENLATRAAFVSPGDVAAMENGTEVFYPWAIWAVYGIGVVLKKTQGLWRAMPLPAWTPGGSRAAVMGGSSFIIPKKAKNPHLAWLFYEFLMYNPEGYRAVFGANKIYPTGINTLLPSYKPALQHQLFGNVAALGGQNLWDVATGTVEQISNEYYYPTWYNQAVSYFGSNIQRVMDGQLSPQDALSQSADQIQSKLISRS